MFFLTCIVHAQNDLIIVHESDTSRFEYRMYSSSDSLTELSYYRYDILLERMRLNGVVRNGEYSAFFEDGKLSVNGFYNSKGLKDGTWKHFYPSGILSCIYNFIDGNMQGDAVCFFQNGLEKSRGKCISVQNKEAIDGLSSEPAEEVKVGEWKYYYDNGQLKNEGNYFNYSNNSGSVLERNNSEKSLKHGKWIHFDREGNFIKTEIFNMGELTELSHNEYAKD